MARGILNYKGWTITTLHDRDCRYLATAPNGALYEFERLAAFKAYVDEREETLGRYVESTTAPAPQGQTSAHWLKTAAEEFEGVGVALYQAAAALRLAAQAKEEGR
jgi:hypothetical protein